MTFFLVVVLLALFLIVFAIKIKNKKPIDGGSSTFISKNPLSMVEQIAYWRIKEAVGEDGIVLAQVAFSSFIQTSGDKKKGYSKFNQARQKVADFVICDKDFSIFAIIEIDDKTHNKEKDIARDAITEEAGIKTYRLEAKYLPTADEIRKAILS